MSHASGRHEIVPTLDMEMQDTHPKVNECFGAVCLHIEVLVLAAGTKRGREREIFVRSKTAIDVKICPNGLFDPVDASITRSSLDRLYRGARSGNN